MFPKLKIFFIYFMENVSKSETFLLGTIIYGQSLVTYTYH
jgi:hypothetical protein